MPYIGLGNSAVSGQGHIPPGLNPKILSVTRVNEWTNEVIWKNSPKTTSEFDGVYLMKSEDGEHFKQTPISAWSQPLPTSGIDDNVAPGITYYYQVWGYHYDELWVETIYKSDIWVENAWSPSIQSPTGLSSTPVDRDTIRLTWTNAQDIDPGTKVEVKFQAQDYFPDPSYSPIFMWDNTEGYGILVTAADSTGINIDTNRPWGVGIHIRIRYKTATESSEYTDRILALPTTLITTVPINIVGTANIDNSTHMTWTNTYTTPAATAIVGWTTNDLYQGFGQSFSISPMPQTQFDYAIGFNPGDQYVYFMMMYTGTNVTSQLSPVTTVILNP